MVEGVTIRDVLDYIDFAVFKYRVDVANWEVIIAVVSNVIVSVIAGGIAFSAPAPAALAIVGASVAPIAGRPGRTTATRSERCVDAAVVVIVGGIGIGIFAPGSTVAFLAIVFALIAPIADRKERAVATRSKRRGGAAFTVAID